MKTGKVWLIGAGPGDPELFTIGGSKALKQADIIIYDALANSFLLAYANPEAELIYVGKIADQHSLPQNEINALLAKYALEGFKVARLKGGDPYIFGRGGEEAEYLVERGIPFEEIPGISSAIAAPAYAGIPLTHRDFVSSVSIITGHEKSGKESSLHDWNAFVKSRSTLVFLMGMRNLPEICRKLLDAGMDAATPGAVIYRGTTPMQQTVIAPLELLPEKVKESGLQNPGVIVIGKVVTLANKLDWFEKKPLLGKTIVVTRAREQASEIASILSQYGAMVIQCPTIKISPLEDYEQADRAIAKLKEYKWIIFTSVNGVKFFWDRLAHANRDSRALYHCKVAAIGPATAIALEERGIRPDLIPDAFMGEGIAEAIVSHEGEKLKDKKILIPRALVARSALPELLTRAGARVEVVPVYQTEPEQECMEEVRKLLPENKIDCITFSSSSTVDNFFKLISSREIGSQPDIALAAIGPVTANALAKYDLKAAIQPASYTIPALIDSIIAYFSDLKP